MSLLRSQPVLVRLSGADALHARVDDVDPHEVTLVLAVRPGDRVPDRSATIEYLTPTGIHRIEGELRHDRRDPSVLKLRRAGERVVQRREWARVDALIPVEVRFEVPDIGLAATVAVNVSGGGALIRDPVGLPIGSSVRLALDFGGAPIGATARVVRADGSAKGVELDVIDAADRERIVRFVMERQRADLRLRRVGA